MVDFIKDVIRLKWLVIACTLLAAGGGGYYALVTPNEYRAEVMLMPVDDGHQSNLGIGGQLGGLASLAGISTSGSSEKVALASELLNDWHFVDSFIKKHHLKPDVLAVEGWLKTDDTLLYDDGIYDASAKKWLTYGQSSQEPSDWSAYNKFKKNIVFRKSKDTPVITVTLSHYSPHKAAMWLDLLIGAINQKIKDIDVEETRTSLTYLQAKVEETQVAELREVFYELMQQQLKKLMLAEIRKEYVLRKVGPIKVPQAHFKPRRLIITVLSGFFGGILGVLMIISLPGFSKLRRELKQN